MLQTVLGLICLIADSTAPEPIEHIANFFTSNSGDSELLNFQQHICDYVVTQSSDILDEKTFLATSDVIESLFGKYKQFSARCPFKEMGQMLLTMCLSTMNLTNTVVKNTLEAISFADVEAWLAEVFG